MRSKGLTVGVEIDLFIPCFVVPFILFSLSLQYLIERLYDMRLINPFQPALSYAL